MPGTELAFTEEVATLPHGLLGWRKKKTATGRQSFEVYKESLLAL